MTFRTKSIFGVGLVACLGALAYWKFAPRVNNDSADPSVAADLPGAVAKSVVQSGSAKDESIQPGRTGFIRGVVRLGDGGVLNKTPATTIQLRSVMGQNTSEPVTTVDTISADSDGHFEFAEVALGSYRVSASLPGFLPAVSDILEVRANDKTSVELALTRGGSPVSGTISDISGGPVAGAAVHMTPARGILGSNTAASFATLTDANGHFELTAADGSYAIAASHPDYVSSSNTRVELRGAKKNIQIRLVPGGVVEGTVVGAATGNPAPFARVSYTRQTTQRTLGTAIEASVGGGTVVADKNGHYRIQGARSGTLSISAVANGARTRDAVIVPLAIAESIDGVDLFLESAYSISGQVVSPDGGPASGATIIAMGEDGSEPAATQSTASDGRFTLSPLPPGSYRLTVGGSSPNPLQKRSAVTVELVDADIDGVELTAKSLVTIHGRVDPAADAEISIAHERGGLQTPFLAATQTEADGSFSLGSFEPGQTIPLRAITANGKVGDVEVKVGRRDVRGVVISLQEAASLSGTVIDEAGKPVSGATVTMVAKSATRTVMINGTEVSARRSVTRADGGFSVAGLTGGDYRLSIKNEHGEALRWAKPSRQKQVGTTLPIPVSLADHENRSGLRLHVEATNESIEGVVVDSDGRPARDVFVTVSPTFDLNEMLARSSVPAPPNRQIRGPQDSKTSQNDSKEVVMMISSDGDDSLGGGLGGGSRPPVVTDAKGRFRVDGLRRGQYDITAEGARGSARGSMTTVETGSDVQLKLISLTKLLGTVSFEDKPVDDFTVTLRGPLKVSRRFKQSGGRFTIGRLDPGKYTVEVSAQQGSASMPATIAAGEPTQINLTLMGQPKVRGKLVDANGAPVVGAIIILNPATNPNKVDIVIDSNQTPPRSTADGSFVVSASPGQYVLMAIVPGTGLFLNQPITVGTADQNLGTITPHPEHSDQDLRRSSQATPPSKKTYEDSDPPADSRRQASND